MQVQLLETALQMPDAYIFMERLKNSLEKEKAKRKEFYKIIDENKKMEFINGEIYFHSPVKLWHNETSGHLYQMISAFIRKKKLGKVGIEKLLISLTRNDYEPDVCFWKSHKSEHFKGRQMQFPAPDFVAEVLSDSTAKHDRGIKYQDYESHGVKEYWIIDAEKQTIEQYVLDENDEYELLQKTHDGMIKSVAIEGFEIPVKSVFDEDLNAEILEEIWSR
jgi:Uma2 family endonuclease